MLTKITSIAANSLVMKALKMIFGLLIRVPVKAITSSGFVELQRKREGDAAYS